MLDAQETVIDDGHVDALAQFSGQQGRLVVTSLAHALRVQGHGHDSGGREGGPLPCLSHYLAEIGGQYSRTLILEVVYALSYTSFEVGCRSDSIYVHRVAGAAMAQIPTGQGSPTYCTDRRLHVVEAGDAIWAKPFPIVATHHAVGREEHIQDGVSHDAPARVKAHDDTLAPWVNPGV